MADFSHYYDTVKKLDYEVVPALRKVSRYDCSKAHGCTPCMPGEYCRYGYSSESGLSLSIRTLHQTLQGKHRETWNIEGMRNTVTLLKDKVPKWWYQNKK